MESQDHTVGVMTDRVVEMNCTKCGCHFDVSDLESFTRIQCPKCHTQQTVPARLGSFLLLELLGTGGMGGVYYAKDETLGRYVAIKVMLKSLGDDLKLVETFKNEAQAVAKLNHPNIAQIYSFGQEKGQPYIVMELVTGRHFDKMIDEQQLDQALVVKIILDVAEGLQAADEVGLVHGDIKPENILLDDKMQAKLVDFGLATLVNQASQDGIWGTPYYISPEKIRRQKADARSDIYSLGATMYHALTGNPPFEGETPVEVVKARLEAPPPPLSDFREDIDEQVEDIVMRMLEPEAMQRYPNYRSLTGDLSKALQALGGPPRISGVKTVRVRPKKSTGAQSDTIATDGDSGKSGKGGKIVIRRGTGSGGISSRPTNTSRRRRTEEADQAKEVKQRRKTSKALVVFELIVLLALAGVGVGLHLKDKKDVEIRRRRETFALAQAHKDAATAYANIDSSVSRMMLFVQTVPARFARVTNAVYMVEGYVPALSIEPEPEPEPEPAAEQIGGTEVDDSDAEPSETGDVEAAADSVAEPAEDAVAEVAEENQDDPAPLDEAIVDEVPAPAIEEEPEEAPAAVVDEPEIVRLAREAAEKLRAVTTLGARSEKVREHARELLAATEAASVSTTANRRAKRLGELQTVGKRMLSEIKTASERADPAIARIEETAVRIVRNREEAARQHAEAERQKVEEAARQRAEEAKRVKIEEERLRAVNIWAENVEDLKQGNYSKALKTITDQIAEFETDEGKAEVRALADRCQHLVDLRAFVIERLNAAPFKWGWVQSGSPQDVVEATPGGVRVRSGIVSWSEVSVGQMLKFIQKYLPDRTINVRVRADRYVGAAIFCVIHGGQDYAIRYADQAVEIRPNAAEEIKRLLPNLKDQEEPGNAF